MTAYRPPDFRERAALSRQAKQKALNQLRAKHKPNAAAPVEIEAGEAAGKK